MRPVKEFTLDRSEAEVLIALELALVKHGWRIDSQLLLGFLCTKRLKGSLLSLVSVKVNIQIISLTASSTKISISTTDSIFSFIPILGVDESVEEIVREITRPSREFSGKADLQSFSLRRVTINNEQLTDEDVKCLEQMVKMQVQDGAYWYDNSSGAWGVQGGPVTGFIHSGLNLGGPLRSNASNGNTGVFINGRQLHVIDVMGLQKFCPVYPGRYWVDGQGNFGYEGGPTLGNLQVLSQRSAGSGGNNGGAWSASSATGTVGGDGEGGYYYSGKSGTSWSNL